MLINLVIRNYALIRKLEMQPADGLNIITGETGAGKSIMLGAVGLLLGNRADTKVLLDEDTKCIIEGTFRIAEYDLKDFFYSSDLDFEEETIIRREISPSGKTRAFINDTPVTLDVLRTLGAYLMDIHSQHETLLLAKSSFQIDLIDAFADNLGLRKEYQKEFTEYKNLVKELEELRSQKLKDDQEADYRHFILQELIDADLQENEQEVLENELRVLENAEEIKSKLSATQSALQDEEYAALESLRQAQSFLQDIRAYARVYEEIFERLNSAFLEIDDLAQELSRLTDTVDYDPKKTAELQERLNLIYQLQQKHHVSDIAGLIGIREQLDAEVYESGEMETRLVQLQDSISAIQKRLSEKADKLSSRRMAVADELSSSIETLLSRLGMPDAKIVVRMRALDELSEYGLDECELEFSANKGIEPRPLSKVASGGEMSRVMFAIKHILAEKIALPTIIFDEIDAGISGEVAMRMGEMMKFMSRNHQIISISHLPQIAARADRHYFVFKDQKDDKTVSQIRQLSQDERILEIAKMIGGDKPSNTAMENARELVEDIE